MDGTFTLSKGECSIRDVSSTDPFPAAELAVLIKEQAIALAEEMSKNKRLKRRYLSESDNEDDDNESDNEAGDANKNKNGKDDERVSNLYPPGH